MSGSYCNPPNNWGRHEPTGLLERLRLFKAQACASAKLRSKLKGCFVSIPDLAQPRPGGRNGAGAPSQRPPLTRLLVRRYPIINENMQSRQMRLSVRMILSQAVALP